jgi:hypothetical protein
MQGRIRYGDPSLRYPDEERRASFEITGEMFGCFSARRSVLTLAVTHKFLRRDNCQPMSATLPERGNSITQKR